MTAGPLYSNIILFYFTFGTPAQRLRLQRLQHTDSGPWSHKGMASAVLPPSVTRVSCASLANASPASCPVSRRRPVPLPQLGSSLDLLLLEASLCCLSAPQGRKGEDWALASLMLTSPYICFCFQLTGKNWSSDFNWQGPPGSFQGKRRYLTSV